MFRGHDSSIPACSREMSELVGLTIDELLDRQENELKALALEIKAMVKAAKKSQRAEAEAKGIQMEFDLKARHRDEVDELEEYLASPSAAQTAATVSDVNQTLKREQEAQQAAAAAEAAAIEAKRAKAQKKKVRVTC